MGRSSRALLAFTATAGVTFHATTFPTALADDQASVESYLADLVGQVTDAESQVSELEGKIGGLRESSNKARVDLAQAQDEAQKAQDAVNSARERLDKSDKDVTDAQSKLDEIARSAYAQGGDALAVNLAAGGSDAVADTLDRSSFIKLATEKQQSEVDRLDLARTQTANEESTLRASRSTADSALSSAVDAYKQANEALQQSMNTLAELQQRYQQLKVDREKAEARLRAARSAVDTLANSNPEASSFDKRRAAEEAVSKADNDISAIDAAKDEDETEAQTEDSQAAEDTQAAEDSQAAEGDASNADSDMDSNSADVTPWAGTAKGGKKKKATSSVKIPDVSGIQTTFEGSSSGDSQRQQAINGLVKAGEAAVLAGFTAYAGKGDEKTAAQAAIKEGRRVAGEQYDAAMANQASATTTGGGTTTTTTTDSATATTTTGTTDSTTGGTTDTMDSTTGTTRTTDSDSTATGATGTTGNNGTATTQSTKPADSSVDTSGDAAAKIERVIARANSQLGVSYAWGGGGPNGPTLGIRDGGVADAHGDYAKVGFDCSGLMMYAFAAVGIQLSHYSGYQYTAGRQVPVSEAKRGDMLFWGPGGSQHVALYLGNGQMIEAPQSGSTVQVSNVRWSGIQPMAVRLIE
ncbi:hydrolase [Corynebacterium sp. zg254]|uniref:Hydrolase n=1 Tax=Corynebacterium zhongnanshanii TaxID=2768834 RepID=A0ABQ6VGZ5_9CORY|nr:hydrolase [Corynebacterium zhongnanshanii]MCR5913358.1 hydrolase [Corynebacterium sp. zg254]